MHVNSQLASTFRGEDTAWLTKKKIANKIFLVLFFYHVNKYHHKHHHNCKPFSLAYSLDESSPSAAGRMNLEQWYTMDLQDLKQS